MNDQYPEVLVISNQCFSKSTSNGRTLGLLFEGWPKDRLGQFCISLTDPDYDICDNYFNITDRDALRSFLSLGSIKSDGRVSILPDLHVETHHSGRPHKNALKMLLRNLVWDSRLWHGAEFEAWLDRLNPALIVLQSGDSAFMLNIAVGISKIRHIPLVVYNTEGYYFFDHNYLPYHWSDKIAFPIFRHLYRKSFRRLMKQADHAIYLNDRLKSDYDKAFAGKSDVIYNSSSLTFDIHYNIKARPIFSYLGNLGIKRPEALVEFADVLGRIDKNLHLDIYGDADSRARQLFKTCPFISFHGLVSYDKVREIMQESDVLVHVEKNDPVLARELRYAFSTKIADSLCSGRNFIVYAPTSLACAQYVKTTGAAWQASDPEDLEIAISSLLSDSAKRTAVLDNARHIASVNHSAAKNAARFRSIILDCLK